MLQLLAEISYSKMSWYMCCWTLVCVGGLRILFQTGDLGILFLVSLRDMHTYIYIYLVLFCFMDIFWSFILSGSVSLLIIGTSRENYHLCGIYRVRVTGFLSLFSSLSCSTSLLQYKLSSWILILLICLFLCHCK